MADSKEESSTAGVTSSAAAVTSYSPAEKDKKKSWGDEADEEDAQNKLILDQQNNNNNNKEKEKNEELDHKLDSLTIEDDSNKKEEQKDDYFTLQDTTDDDNNSKECSKKEEEEEKDDYFTLQHTTVTSAGTMYRSVMTFEELNLSPELVKGLYAEMNFERPSEIQAQTLPMILTPPHSHLIAQARNGSGKTTCFVLGMLGRIDPQLTAPQALCICPTRELAIQNLEVLKKMGKYTGITSECAIPMDVSSYVPISKLAPITSQIVIGTPGTINKMVANKKLSLSSLKILVFDEADHMLAESGFRDDSVKIMKAIVRSSPDCQVLLFSATFDDRVRSFVSNSVKGIFKGKYNEFFVKKEDLSLQSIKQFKVRVPNDAAKTTVIRDRIFELGNRVGQTIIFMRTRRNAAALHQALNEYGYGVTTIQGGLRQEDRDKIVKEFKDGLTQVLISTDVLARGFDQSKVNLVVNFDLPVQHESPTEPDCEVYLHRVGRAGRFGRKGACFNLLCDQRDEMIMSKIEKHFDIQVDEVPSWESEKDFEEALKTAKLL